nr:hypothetical protein [Allomuricauda sp.]
MDLLEKHYKKLLKSTEPAFYDESVKEDIMRRILSQNIKKKSNSQKLARFCLWTSVFLALAFLSSFVQDIGFDLSLDLQGLQLSRIVMALIFIIVAYTIIELHNGLSKANKSGF